MVCAKYWCLLTPDFWHEISANFNPYKTWIRIQPFTDILFSISQSVMLPHLSLLWLNVWNYDHCASHYAVANPVDGQRLTDVGDEEMAECPIPAVTGQESVPDDSATLSSTELELLVHSGFLHSWHWQAEGPSRLLGLLLSSPFAMLGSLLVSFKNSSNKLVVGSLQQEQPI